MSKSKLQSTNDNNTKSCAQEMNLIVEFLVLKSAYSINIDTKQCSECIYKCVLQFVIWRFAVAISLPMI